MLLEMRSICKDYPQGKDVVHILKNISLEIDDGDYLAIMGPSGSGKSTLLNIIGGIESADGGSISIEGEKLADMKEKKLSRFTFSIHPI